MSGGRGAIDTRSELNELVRRRAEIAVCSKQSENSFDMINGTYQRISQNLQKHPFVDKLSD